MLNINIRNKCFVNIKDINDDFVGIRCKNGDIKINFPMGFKISDNDDELRKDILLLINTLSLNTEKKESEILGNIRQYEKTQFPIQSYIEIIKSFYNNGYYKERESIYSVSKKGKINWNRTIKTQKPYVQNNKIFYLDLVTKKNTINDDKLITLIHEYCVYDSFRKVGWLFSKNMPKKPQIKFNKKLFITIITEKLTSTFNDVTRRLFNNMIAIINYTGDLESEINYKYGTYRFEYVWEKMIDRVFGIENKSDYFPRTKWIVEQSDYNNAALEPDTIMISNNNIYILDAKYYKFGVTAIPKHLPESTSINKQITYGEYIYEDNEKKFRRWHGEKMKVYNAFIMPFDSQDIKYEKADKIYYIGEAVSNWKDGCKEYERIQGILIDTKFLMKNNIRQNESDIIQLSNIINNAVCINKNKDI